MHILIISVLDFIIILLLMLRQPAIFIIFPYTTLFRSQSIESDSRKIGQSHEQHAINFEHARQDVRRKRREFASDFDKWTRGNGKEQQQDGKSSSRDAKIERGGIESDKQRNKHE